MHYKNSDLIDSNPYDSKILFIQTSEHGLELLIQELLYKSQIATWNWALPPIDFDDFYHG